MLGSIKQKLADKHTHAHGSATLAAERPPNATTSDSRTLAAAEGESSSTTAGSRYDHTVAQAQARAAQVHNTVKGAVDPNAVFDTVATKGATKEPLGSPINRALLLGCPTLVTPPTP